MRLNTRGLAAGALCAVASVVWGQSVDGPTRSGPLTPPANGPKSAPAESVRLVNATVHPAPGVTLDNATVVLDKGLVSQVLSSDGRRAGLVRLGDGSFEVRYGGVAEAGGVREIDCSGLHIYAGFIEPYLEVETPASGSAAGERHSVDRVRAARSVLDGPGAGAGDRRSLRRLGFTTAVIAPDDGIFRGTSAAVSLADDFPQADQGTPPVYARGVYQAMAFERGRGYPSSHMGAASIMRQAFLDADWAAENGREPEASLLGSLRSDGGDLLVVTTGNTLETMLASKIAREMDRRVLIVGAGDEYERLDAIAADAASGVLLGVVVPLRYPEKPDVSTPGKADAVDLATMLRWEQAPTNARRLFEAGVPIAVSADKSQGNFWGNYRRAVREGGLDETAALGAITTSVADLLGLGERHGRVVPGAAGNLVITDGALFDDDTRIVEVYVDGRLHRVGERDLLSGVRERLAGAWTMPLAGGPELTLVFENTGEGRRAKTTLHVISEGEGGEASAGKARSLTIDPSGALSFVIDDADGYTGSYPQSGVLVGEGESARLVGTGVAPDGTVYQWSAERAAMTDRLRGLISPKGKSASGDGDEGRDGVSGEARASVDGVWDALLSGRFALRLEIDGESVRITELGEGGEVVASQQAGAVRRAGAGAVSFDFEHEPFGVAGTFSMQGELGEGGALAGTGTRADGRSFEWTAERVGGLSPGGEGGGAVQADAGQAGARQASADDEDAGEREVADARDAGEDDADRIAEPGLRGYPFGLYSMAGAPAQRATLFVNGTIWTSGPEGRIDRGWVYIDGGKIRGVGSGDPDGVRVASDALTVDLDGRHLTPGIIDAHSHTGLFSLGVNEGAQAITSEVRIDDAVDPGHINWYRQLGGGVTSVLSLHGSANSIGGQSQINKVRWGAERPSDLAMEDGKPGIKFALGENPRGSNNNRFGDTYPQSRMGVEMQIRDRLHAAREYASMDAGSRRPDLELEPLVEVISGERLVHCHSYRQDEILMLTKVAEEFGFTIGTFQHGLEVYKVAEAVREHALGASIFSDWWAYKFEVIDAIPYAGPLQTRVGVLTSFNSDSDELSRRLNREAAKAVRYSDGHIGEEEALKFVTINPAIQMGVGDRIGSIEVGKDADLAVWSTNPLSMLARCEATYVDGRRYFSLEDDRRHRESMAAERARLVKVILESPVAPTPTQDKPLPDAAEEGDQTDRPTLLAGAGQHSGHDHSGHAHHDHAHGHAGHGHAEHGHSGHGHEGHSHATGGPVHALALDLSLPPEEIARLLREHFMWHLERGLDPMTPATGVCGCEWTGSFSGLNQAVSR